MVIFSLIVIVLWWFILLLNRSKKPIFHPTKKAKPQEDKPSLAYPRNAKKPDWVRRKIIYLKAMQAIKGGRKITEDFNRLHAEKDHMTVGKTYVYETLKKYRYEIYVLRRKFKHRRPRKVAKNVAWGIDLTTVTDQDNQQHCLLGIIDYGSRACITLERLDNKASLTLLRQILKAIFKYGKPKSIKTDNEAIFISRVWRLGLRCLGIKHQTSDIACPWQNGRIERFFGTFKEKANQCLFGNGGELDLALPEFRLWYNHIRSHSNLDGKTPAEVWDGVDIFTQGYKSQHWFERWDGLLTGFYLPT